MYVITTPGAPKPIMFARCRLEVCICTVVLHYKLECGDILLVCKLLCVMLRIRVSDRVKVRASIRITICKISIKCHHVACVSITYIAAMYTGPSLVFNWLLYQ